MILDMIARRLLLKKDKIKRRSIQSNASGKAQIQLFSCQLQVVVKETLKKYLIKKDKQMC